jgi:hypothetical protein
MLLPDDEDENVEQEEQEQERQEEAEAQVMRTHCRHNFQFVEALPSNENDVYCEILQCVSGCGKIKILHFNVGVCDN